MIKNIWSLKFILTKNLKLFDNLNSEEQLLSKVNEGEIQSLTSIAKAKVKKI